jgi:hypothetical protein
LAKEFESAVSNSATAREGLGGDTLGGGEMTKWLIAIVVAFVILQVLANPLASGV